MPPQVIASVDIAVCTWNRDALLAQTVDSFIRLRIPDSVSVSVLIVDNNSTDHTPSVIESFVATVDSHPDLARRMKVIPLSETNQGHTFSRNRAIAKATGDLMLWTDDDVVVAPDWIEKYVAVANAEPESIFWGSVIEPAFEHDKPVWVQENWENLKGCFAHRDLGEQSIPFTESRLPYGANFAIRTVLQKQFLFSNELGRRGLEVLGEDELDLFRRLLAAGHQGSWIPGAVVDHVIPAERATEKYVYDYFVGQGRALVEKNEAWHADVEKFRSEARSEYLKYKIKRPFSESMVWVSHMLRSALAQGQHDALSNRES